MAERREPEVGLNPAQHAARLALLTGAGITTFKAFKSLSCT